MYLLWLCIDKCELSKYHKTFLNFVKFIKIHFISGDLINEEEVLNWLIEQKTTATIEEVTDEILKGLVEEHEYVLVYFSELRLYGHLTLVVEK